MKKVPMDVALFILVLQILLLFTGNNNGITINKGPLFLTILVNIGFIAFSYIIHSDISNNNTYTQTNREAEIQKQRLERMREEFLEQAEIFQTAVKVNDMDRILICMKEFDEMADAGNVFAIQFKKNLESDSQSH